MGWGCADVGDVIEGLDVGVLGGLGVGVADAHALGIRQRTVTMPSNQMNLWMLMLPPLHTIVSKGAPARGNRSGLQDPTWYLFTLSTLALVV